MANGSFGSNNNRNISNNSMSDGDNENHFQRLRNIRERAGRLSPERWVDIVCCSLLLIFGIAIACTWSSFMDRLFYNVLFPVIYVGGKILAIVAVIAIVIGLISLRFRRRRYYW